MKNPTLYDGETFEYKGHRFSVSFPLDNETTPFDDDSHGPVRYTRMHHIEGSSDKRPGERPLNQPDRHEYQYYYDWQSACKMARKDSWNAEPFDAPNRILRAVQADFDFLRGYLSGAWQYVGIELRRIDANGETLDETSCYGFEMLNDYHIESAYAMADELIANYKRKFSKQMAEAKERKYWASRDVETV